MYEVTAKYLYMGECGERLVRMFNVMCARNLDESHWTREEESRYKFAVII